VPLGCRHKVRTQPLISAFNLSFIPIDEAREAADSNRLVPPFDASATDPADVYPLRGIIPEVEWKALSISTFEQASSDKERQALFFVKWSKWINEHVTGKREQSDETSKARKKTL